jgi:hypothetical protein
MYVPATGLGVLPAPTPDPYIQSWPVQVTVSLSVAAPNLQAIHVDFGGGCDECLRGNHVKFCCSHSNTGRTS